MTTINAGVLDGVRRIGAGVRDLSVQGGIGGAPLGMRIKGATLSGAPVTGTWKPGDLVTDRTGKIWQCTAGGTPGTWVQAGAALDPNAGDIQPSPGTASAGSSSLGARADHVHGQPPFVAPTGLTGATAAIRYLAGTTSGPPMSGTWAVGDLVPDQQGAIWECTAGGTPGTWKRAGDQPWQFRPVTYGAKGNGVLFSDAAITSGQAVLTSPGNHLAGATTGMYVRVIGAGAAGADLFQTIASVQGPGQVTLSGNAGTTVSAAGCIFGNDDVAAVNSAVTAAVAYAQAHSGYAEVLFDALTYIMAGAPTIGGSTAGNAQVPLPVIADTAQKVTLAFRGTLDQTALNHWLQTVPQAAGTVLACLRSDGTNDVTNGPSCVIGGPYAGYGANTSLFSNMLVVIDGIEAMVPLNGTYGGFDFFGVAEANVPNAACMAMAVVPSGGAWPYMGGVPSYFSNFGWFGLRMPSTNNNANSNVGWFTAEGMVNGFRPSEHTVWESVRTINCYAGIAPYVGTSGTMAHSMVGKYSSVENCINAVSPLDGPLKADLAVVDTEQINNNLLNDPSNNYIGYLGYRAFGTPVIAGGGANARVINLSQVPGVWSGAPSAPGTGVAQQNTSWRDGTVYVTSTAAITALAIDGTSIFSGSLASGTLVPVRVPSGHTYTVTSSGGTLTTHWVLD